MLKRVLPWCCLLSGALVPLSFAPFSFWYVAIPCIAFFLFALHECQARQIFWRSWLFGIGLFGSGVSWVYVSIHEYGYAPIPLAVFLTALFAVGLGLVFALPFWFYSRYPQKKLLVPLLVFPSLWVLGEWLRSWLLTGFPWLYLGYAHVETPLSGWLPLTGVYGASWITVFSAAALWHAYQYKKFLPLSIASLLFAAGWGLQHISWTTIHRDAPIQVGIVQPNFSLHDKWDADKRLWIRDTLTTLSAPLWQQDVILWPEAALNEFYHEALPFLRSLDQQGKENHTTVITGLLTYDLANSTPRKHVVYNSVTALGEGSGLYHKVRLVPFGEYMPLESWLRGLIRFFDLPSSHMSPGNQGQTHLQAGSHRVAPFICYEIVYPDLVARNSQAANYLMTISNDSWFGDSLGPPQHLQMAQARAIETQRYLIRGTNDGISAIIDPQGKIVHASTRFLQQTLQGEIFAAQGNTPFMYGGSWPMIAVLFVVLIVVYRRRQ